MQRYMGGPDFWALVEKIVEAATDAMPDFAAIVDRERIAIALGVHGDLWIEGTGDPLPVDGTLAA